jgi:hypothetical protein
MSEPATPRDAFACLNARERALCVFRAKVATDSGRTLPPIPGEGCH